MYKTVLFALLLFVDLFAIGRQHGTFRSQSTQGPPWQGTSRIIREEYEITVHPDYLDVSLEWEFNVGGAPPDTFKNALEIVGNLNLEAGSVVIGMLLWNGDEILKAKLKPIGVARAQYEEVVDRNAPAPTRPRDPVIFENSGWYEDNYDISIFPVTWGATRKLRFRYLIPGFNNSGSVMVGYPTPFTSNAKVTIKTGEDAAGFRLHEWYKATNGSALLLQASNVGCTASDCFEPSGTNFVEPVSKKISGASRLYIGDFSVPGFSGQTAHFHGGSTDRILAQMKTEVVILWRWNHPEFLKKYGYMIVEQSERLKAFLQGLDSANQKCAMVIDIMGGERIEFKMDGKGGSDFTQMAAFLQELSSLAKTSWPAGPKPQYTDSERDSLVIESVREFDEALEKAISFFTGRDGVIKHLVLLTAGPRWIDSDNFHSVPAIDESIGVSCLNEADWQWNYYQSDKAPFWPGVDIREFLSRGLPRLELTAGISNGQRAASTRPVSVPAAPGGISAAAYPNSLKLYSDAPLKEMVSWQLRQNGILVGSYDEAPEVIRIQDGLQYARLIGAAKDLIPLAAAMPSSLAATLGFVDEEYALLALEDDVMDEDLQHRYAGDGVPGLNPEDIFPDVSESDSIPVQQWVDENNPGADEFMSLAADGRKNKLMSGMVFFIKNGMLIVELSSDLLQDVGGLEMVIYDLSGKAVKRWGRAELAGKNRITWSPKESGLNTGIFLLRVSGSAVNVSRRIFVK